MKLTPDSFTVNPSWGFIGKMFICVAALAFLLTAVIGVAQPLGWLDPLHERVEKSKPSHQPTPLSQYSAPLGE